MTRIILSHGACELTSLPGCAQIVVSHNALIYPGSRGMGLGKKAHAERLCVIEDMGYDYALCTVRDGNSRQEAILNGHEWVRLTSFTSSYTENEVSLYGRHIKR